MLPPSHFHHSDTMESVSGCVGHSMCRYDGWFARNEGGRAGGRERSEGKQTIRVARGKLSHGFNASWERRRPFREPEEGGGRERTPASNGGTAGTQGSMIGRPKVLFPTSAASRVRAASKRAITRSTLYKETGEGLLVPAFQPNVQGKGPGATGGPCWGFLVGLFPTRFPRGLV